MRPSGLVPWLAINTLFPLEEMPSEAKPLQLGTPMYTLVPPCPCAALCANHQMEKADMIMAIGPGKFTTSGTILKFDGRGGAGGAGKESHARKASTITCKDGTKFDGP